MAVLGVRSLVLFLVLVLGYQLGVAFGPRPGGAPGSAATGSRKAREVWTCSMHPQIRLGGPGSCPICSMPLIPAGGSGDLAGTGGGAPALSLTQVERARVGVETVAVERRSLATEIRTVGRIGYDETTLTGVSARVNGYVERLFVDYTGVPVRAGDHLVEIYSPDLVVAQQELLIAAKSPGGGPLLESSRQKLRWLGISAAQVDEILRSGKVQERMTVYSPSAGTVVEKPVVAQAYVEPGTVLFRLADLTRVWAFVEVYEYELAGVRLDQEVELEAEAYPGEVFRGRVGFVSPVVDETTRTVRVRVNIANRDQRLKPGMFVRALLRAPVEGGGGGEVPVLWTCPMHPEIAAPGPGSCPLCGMKLDPMELEPEPTPALPPSYTCPMHPDVLTGKPGSCPTCGMKLVVAEGRGGAGRTGGGRVLAVPVAAVLDAGFRKLVYVERAPGEYEQVEARLGPRAGDWYPVLGGLAEGDRVVARGNLLIDSQFQIRGLAGALAPGGTPAGSR